MNNPMSIQVSSIADWGKNQHDPQGTIRVPWIATIENRCSACEVKSVAISGTEIEGTYHI